MATCHICKIWQMGSRLNNSPGFKMDTKVGMTGTYWYIFSRQIAKVDGAFRGIHCWKTLKSDTVHVPCSIASIENTLLLFGWFHRNSGWETWFLLCHGFYMRDHDDIFFLKNGLFKGNCSRDLHYDIIGRSNFAAPILIVLKQFEAMVTSKSAAKVWSHKKNDLKKIIFDTSKSNGLCWSNRLLRHRIVVTETGTHQPTCIPPVHSPQHRLRRIHKPRFTNQVD